MSDSLDFYRRLSAGDMFSAAADTQAHADLPADWWIVVADITGSTRAIEAGAYKSVNTVGVACIAAVTNVDRSVALPFIFGGDGATFAVPDALRDRVASALRASQRMARDAFGLELRAGMVRAGDLAAGGYRARLGKLRLSQQVTQPVLSGKGWEEAERRVKGASAAPTLLIREDDGEVDGSFEGFECRWSSVPSVNGHKLSLLVSATSEDIDSVRDTYSAVLEKIHAIYGEVAQYHPLRAELMKLSFNPRLLSHEWRVRGLGASILPRLARFAGIVWLNVVGAYLFSRNIDTASVRWSRYRDELVENSDFRKFDGTLRMVIDGSEAQCEQLTRYLEAEFRAGKLVYGIHKSREALVTCIVHSHGGDHMHFVDGSDGGYALAAKEMKRRLKEGVTTVAKEEA